MKNYPVEIVNDFDEIIRVGDKREAHDKGLLHRISAVYLYNDAGEILIQTRVDGRLDHSAAGHVDVGESYDDAAHRELTEELGVKAQVLEKIGKCKSLEDDNVVRHYFTVFKTNAMPGQIQEDEVKEIFWANPHDIAVDMKNHVNDHKYTRGFASTLQVYLGSAGSKA
jgi:isopentenyldiphosphate isomerase